MNLSFHISMSNEHFQAIFLENSPVKMPCLESVKLYGVIRALD